MNGHRLRPAISCLLFLAVLIAGYGCADREEAAMAKRTPEGMVLVPAGKFIMGSDLEDKEGKGVEFGSIKPWYKDEHPKQKIFLEAFYIDKIEVTNLMYQRFLLATGFSAPLEWESAAIPPGRENHPVGGITWYDADNYCQWIGKRLPTEAEWEKAARGTDGQEFPWGNTFDQAKANVGVGESKDTTPVGAYEAGKSPYGAYDMAGNVWEWTQDWYQPYPKSTFQDPRYGEKMKVLRGGGWGGIGHYTLAIYYRSAYRFFADPRIFFNDVGFRCAKTPRREG